MTYNGVVDLDLLREHNSSYFKKKLPSTWVVIDTTELPLEKPSNPDVQVAVWHTRTEKEYSVAII